MHCAVIPYRGVILTCRYTSVKLFEPLDTKHTYQGKGDWIKVNQANVFDVLQERGYLAQCTNVEAVKSYLSTPGASFYIGFDPTADSLHVGHFVQMMIMSHLQKAGLVPIALLGGGTGMVGDPSGRSDLRQVLTKDTIESYIESFKKQMAILVDFSDDKAIMVDNSSWLLDLNLIEFMREIGSQFTVNHMLAAEAYKSRMDSGLTVFEFSYMLLQAYDFLYLYRKFGTRLQIGGDDQWSNILAGTDLIRRKDQGEAYGLTIKLLTTSEGTKMGKTAKGALWLDANKTSPFDFYQYWRNTADADVINCMKMLTFIEMTEINEYAKLRDRDINKAKERLAFEVTKIVHGEDKAKEAERQAQDLFRGAGTSDTMESTDISSKDIEAGLQLLDILVKAKVIQSKSEGRQLIKQNGLLLNSEAVTDFAYLIKEDDFTEGEAIVRKGKKRFHKLTLSQ